MSKIKLHVIVFVNRSWNKLILSSQKTGLLSKQAASDGEAPGLELLEM